MCDELGNYDHMKDYVIDAAGISLCKLDGEGCSSKGKEYLGAWQAKPASDVSAQLVRLMKMKGEGKVTKDARGWISERVGILKLIEKQLQQSGGAGAEL